MVNTPFIRPAIFCLGVAFGGVGPLDSHDDGGRRVVLGNPEHREILGDP